MRIRRLLTASLLGPTLLLPALRGIHAAGRTATAAASASANVVAPIALTRTSDLSWGDFSRGVAGCTMSMNAGGAVTVSAGECSIIAGGGTGPSAARFTVTGAGNRAITWSIPASVTLTSGGDSMVWVIRNDAPGALSGGSATVDLYGTLAVGANQDPNTYTGTVSVTVSY